MSVQELPPDVVRKLLEGYKSCIPDLADRDMRMRESIAERECPQCGMRLEPRLPRDVRRVFGSNGVRYEAHCPEHGLVT